MQPCVPRAPCARRPPGPRPRGRTASMHGRGPARARACRLRLLSKDAARPPARPPSMVFIGPIGRPAVNLRDAISEHPDFPKPGVLFRDFGPLLADPQAVSLALDEIERRFHHNAFDAVAGIDARGFVVAAAAAVRYGKGMVMIRKAGKLPGRTLQASYEIEYGRDTIEIQEGAVAPGQRILVCDDLLATGGTAEAAAGLVERAGGRVAGLVFVAELTELGGASRLSRYPVHSLVRY